MFTALQDLPIRYKKLKPHGGHSLLPDTLSLFAVSSSADSEEVDLVGDAGVVVPYRVRGTFIEFLPAAASEAAASAATW